MDRPRGPLAEDHPGVAEHLRGLLESDFDAVAMVNDGKALLTAAGEIRPDVVVMPSLAGITATAALLARRPGTRVAPVMVYDDSEFEESGYAAGALACVLKLTAADEVVPAARTAMRPVQLPVAPRPARLTDVPDQPPPSHSNHHTHCRSRDDDCS